MREQMKRGGGGVGEKIRTPGWAGDMRNFLFLYKCWSCCTSSCVLYRSIFILYSYKRLFIYFQKYNIVLSLKTNKVLVIYYVRHIYMYR